MRTDSIITVSPPEINPKQTDIIEDTGEILEDKSSTGRPRPWVKKRILTEHVSLALALIEGNEKRSERCGNCGTFLGFAECEKGHRRLQTANFCEERVCPMCGWRRSMRLQIEAIHMLQKISFENPRLRFIFFVFSQRNETDETLKSGLDKVSKSWAKLRKRKEFSVVKGWMRTTEITYNTDPQSPWFHTWNNHMNVVIAVPESYFHSKKYVKHERWRKMWREVMDLDYDPQVSVKAVKMVKSEGQMVPGVGTALEVAKYTLKDSDLTAKTPEETAERLKVLMPALKNRRLVDFGGIMKIKDPEKCDLVHIEGEDSIETHVKNCPTCGGELALHIFRWFSDVRKYVG